MTITSKSQTLTGKQLADKVLSSEEFKSDINNIHTTGALYDYLKTMIGPAMERILQAELSHHLGYEKH